MRGIPTHECFHCGCNQFKILASFDDYEVAWYALTGYCASCGQPSTMPTPLDDPMRNLG